MSSLNESTVSVERISEVLNHDTSEFTSALNKPNLALYNRDYLHGALDAIRAIATSLGIRLEEVKNADNS